MNTELTVKEAALAWAQGKRVEATKAGRDWSEVAAVGESTTARVYSSAVFSLVDYKFRLAPEPPAKRYRPWTPEEVPVGALIRIGNIKGTHCWMINGWNTDAFFTSNEKIGPILYRQKVPAGCEHSTDNGKTWLPCGVEVES